MLKSVAVALDQNVWARGRNGHFKPVMVDILHQEGKYTILAVNSRRRAKSDPIILSLNTEDMERVACAILGVPIEVIRQVRVPEGQQVAISMWRPDDILTEARQEGLCVTLENANDILSDMNSLTEINWDQIRVRLLLILNKLTACIHPKDHETSCTTCEKYFKKPGEK